MKIFPNNPAFADAEHPGMTVRAYLAAKAMSGLLLYVSNDDWLEGELKQREIDIYAMESVRLADALIAALNKGTTP